MDLSYGCLSVVSSVVSCGLEPCLPDYVCPSFCLRDSSMGDYPLDRVDQSTHPNVLREGGLIDMSLSGYFPSYRFCEGGITPKGANSSFGLRALRILPLMPSEGNVSKRGGDTSFGLLVHKISSGRAASL